MANLENLDRTATIARDLIRFDTSNWGEGKANPERPAAEYVQSLLKDLNIESEIFDSAPGRSNLIARIAGTNSELAPLIIHGHLDVVPAVASEWSVDPFAGVIQDGYLWGRGAIDMKHMVAMMIASLERILKNGKLPNRDIIFALFADEEAGGAFGSHYMVEHYPEFFVGAEAAISEIGGYSITANDQRVYLLQTAEKALVWMNLSVTAEPAHGSLVHKNNAVSILAEAVMKIANYEWPVNLTGTTKVMFSELKRILGLNPESSVKELLDVLGENSKVISASFQNTSNPTGLSAGYKHNVIPSTASATIDIRTIPGHEAEVISTIKKLVGPEVEISFANQDIGLEESFMSPIAQKAKELLLRHDPGAEVVPLMISGGTDNKALKKLGISGYGFAPLQMPDDLNFSKLFHGIDERIPLAALEFGTAVLTDLILEF